MTQPEAKVRSNEELLTGLSREPSNSVVLLYSGGIDCTASGLMLGEQGYDVLPLFVDYGQTSGELERYLASTVATELGFRPTNIIESDLIGKLAKSKLLGEVALGDEDAWVPGRNTLLMTIAGIYAQQANADGISLGYMLDDNFVFGDNDFFHHKAMETALAHSFLRPFEVFMPTKGMRKSELVRYLREKEALDKTVSCWNASLTEEGHIDTCGNCANCIERQQAIEEADQS